MKPFIPELKTEFILTKKWNFKLFAESRNFDFARQLGMSTKIKHGLKPTDESASIYWEEKERIASLPKGTILIIDRIYIRRGAKDYSSVTMRTKEKVNTKKGRFWVKLEDFNKAPMESI